MKKIASSAIAYGLAISIALPAFAKTFPDVTNDNYAWAAPYIEQMSDMGLINGYEDGTFRPQNSVTHQEALALFARAMGSASEINSEIVASAVEQYKEVLGKYNIYAKDEVSFLLYRGALKESELDSYIANDVRDTPMKRYESAIIITKAMGAETEAKANLLADLSYTDAKDIPSSAIQYVYYVTEKGLMQGMGNSEFSPQTEVLRSQMAVMLYNTVIAMNLSFEEAKLMEIDVNTKNVRIKDSEGVEHLVGYNNQTKMLVEGELTQPKYVTTGVDAIFTYSDDKLLYVDALTTIPDETVTGKFSGYVTNSSDMSISLLTGSPTTEKTFKCANNVSIKFDDEVSTIKAFTKGDFVTLEISRGRVETIKGESKDVKITGASIESINIEDDITITIGHAQKEYDDVTFAVDSNVSVKKNGERCDLSDIYKGDKATITLQYGVITSIVATSVTKSVEGVIQELVISGKSSAMKVKTNTGVVEYTIPADVDIEINGEEATLYDFRVGDSVKLSIDSEAITKISATAAQTTSKIVTGVVTAINSSYGFIRLDVKVDGITTEETIFCKDDSAKILSSTGSDKKMKNIEVGNTLTVRGTVKNGAFAATVVIIETE